MQTQSTTRKSGGRLRIKLEPPCCDQCRMNKVSCKAPESVDDPCGQCAETHVACSWVLGPRPSGRSPPSPSYVAYLEAQVGKLERKLREILPGVNLNRELETLAQTAAPPHPAQSSIHSNPPPDPPYNPSPTPSSPPRVQVASSHGVLAAPELLKQVRLASEVKVESEQSNDQQSQHHPPLRKDTYWSETASTRPKEPRYHGQSSGEILLRDAKELKQEFEELALSAYGDTPTSNRGSTSRSSSQMATAHYPQFGPQFGPRPNAPAPTIFARPKPPRVRIRQRRAEFWLPTPPEQRVLSRDVWPSGVPSQASWASEAQLNEVMLPPPDLLRSLVDLFFVHVNPFTPFLHRQAFEQELARGTHLLQVLQRREVQDSQDGMPTNANIDPLRGAGTFARVVLLVCACASRWSSDPRVFSILPDETSEANHKPGLLGAGYCFFRQVNPACRTVCAQAGLWDVQIFLLSALYLRWSSALYGAWIVIGIGVRHAQDIGAHRKKDEITIENELYKRSFWSLIVLDRLLSGILGRPSAMQDIDSDLENPIEVDDEHWPMNGEPNQPSGVPSKLSYFSCLIGLSRVLGRAQQTVFAIGRTKRQMDLIGPEKEKMLLNDLQHHMKQWQLTVPLHLRLPHPKSFTPSIFLDQAVSLWATYYNTMILIHRPFITIKSSPLTAECLDICRSSARECAKILDAHLRLDGTGSVTLPLIIQPAFSSAMVLLVDILATGNAGKHGRDGEVLETGESYPMWEKEQDLQRCINVVACAETRWHEAGRLHEILREFQESNRLLIPNRDAQPQHIASVSRLSMPTEPLQEAASESHTEPLTMGTGSMANSSAAYAPNHGSQHAVSYAYAQPGFFQDTGSSSSRHTAAPSNFDPTTQFNHSTHTQSATYPLADQSNYSYPSQSQFHLTDLAHPNPTDPYQLQAGAYLPDAFYGGNLNVPFPGIMPQLNFSPNQGRDGGLEEVSDEGGGQDSGWMGNADHSTSVSEWEMMMNNTLDLARGQQPR